MKTARLSIDRASQEPGIPPDRKLRAWARAVLDTHQPGAEASLRIVDREEMRALNHQYRHQDKATNVLSFPADLPPGLGLPLLGDIAICAPVVSEEAAAQGKTLEAHWAHMLVHGLLHLLGHDHETDDEAETMEALETGILTALDFAPPYE